MDLVAAKKTITTLKTRPGDVRYAQIIQPLTPKKLREGDVVIVGCPDDRGVKRNYGRVGAKLGPTAIRKSLYAATPFSRTLPFSIWDAGDFKMSPSLEKDQARLRAFLRSLFEKNVTTVLLGGGNDWAFCDAAATAEIAKSLGTKHLAVNVDSHLDFRPYPQGPHSGSPFRQLLDAFSETTLVELGLHYHCNSPEYVADAHAAGAQTYFLEDAYANGDAVSDIAASVLNSHTQSIFSVSMDVDSVAVHGVSASYPLGLAPEEFLHIGFLCGRRQNIQSIGFYEVNPKYDFGDHASKLAAICVTEFMRGRAQTRA